MSHFIVTVLIPRQVVGEDVADALHELESLEGARIAVLSGTEPTRRIRGGPADIIAKFRGFNWDKIGTAVDAFIEQQMAPFDEGMEVPEYARECYCINSEARRAARDAAAAVLGPFDAIRDAYWAKVNAALAEGNLQQPPAPETSEEEREVYFRLREEVQEAFSWEEHIAEWVRVEEEAFQAHPRKDMPKPGCEECQGTGKHPSTYNQRSKWDWYRIGGRWDGAVAGGSRESSHNGFNFSADHEQLIHNIATVESLLERKYAPFAIVTPDAVWHEHGEMGWFGISRNEDPKWDETSQLILQQYADHVAVGLDCHI